MESEKPGPDAGGRRASQEEELEASHPPLYERLLAKTKGRIPRADQGFPLNQMK
jgi:hypothetical protein